MLMWKKQRHLRVEGCLTQTFSRALVFTSYPARPEFSGINPPNSINQVPLQTLILQFFFTKTVATGSFSLKKNTHLFLSTFTFFSNFFCPWGLYLFNPLLSLLWALRNHGGQSRGQPFMINSTLVHELRATQQERL